MSGILRCHDCPEGVATYIEIVVDSIPAEDVTEVVRCRNCVYWDKRTTNKNGFDICPASSMEIHERDYCSYGEPKKEDDT